MNEAQALYEKCGGSEWDSLTFRQQRPWLEAVNKLDSAKSVIELAERIIETGKWNPMKTKWKQQADNWRETV